MIVVLFCDVFVLFCFFWIGWLDKFFRLLLFLFLDIFDRFFILGLGGFLVFIVGWFICDIWFEVVSLFDDILLFLGFWDRVDLEEVLEIFWVLYDDFCCWLAILTLIWGICVGKLVYVEAVVFDWFVFDE